MALVVRPGLGLDRDGNAGGHDRHRVDVSLALPRQRVPKPPPLRLERGERALHLGLRVGADSTPASERKPVPSVETQPNRGEEQQPAERRRSRARDHKSEQRGDDASQARFAGVRKTAILLAARVVGHCMTKVWRHVAMFPPGLDDLVGRPAVRQSPRDSEPSTQYLARIAPSETTTTSMPNRYPTPDTSRSSRPGDARDARAEPGRAIRRAWRGSPRSACRPDRRVTGVWTGC
jgi:hypothetical protein